MRSTRLAIIQPRQGLQLAEQGWGQVQRQLSRRLKEARAEEGGMLRRFQGLLVAEEQEESFPSRDAGRETMSA